LVGEVPSCNDNCGMIWYSHMTLVTGDTSFSCTTTNAGASFTLGRMRIFIAASHHPQLGFTPNTSIIWQLKKA
jgi:hypothetical protein